MSKSNSNRPFIELLTKEPQSESYANRIQLIMSKLVTQGNIITLKVTKRLNAIQVSERDDLYLENCHVLKNIDSPPISIEEGSTLIFSPSKLPYKLSDNHLSIQHFIDENGGLYRLCSDGAPFGAVSVRVYSVDLLEASISVISALPLIKAKVTKADSRVRIVNDWMVKKRVELGMPPESSPQEVHDKLTAVEGRERTQKCYWSDWNKLDSNLFSDGVDTRNFFTKDYKQIKFTRGIR